ncbi:MAG: glucuronate isomerase [Bacteroidota bacterium]
MHKIKKTNFINPDFLLQNDLAVTLFHTVAKDLPIIDYHNHINPKDLSDNKKYNNLAQLWLAIDPYKHRLMRINGIAENDITGKATDWEKFYQWACTLPKTVGNPLFHWSYLELKRVFGIDEPLNERSASFIWHTCNEMLQNDKYSIINLIKSWNVQLMSTSDDLLDDLKLHQEVSRSYNNLDIRPSLRGDAMLAFDKPEYATWLSLLANQTNRSINHLVDYQEAILDKLDEFMAAGCLLADHALDPDFYYELPTEQVAANFFKKILDKKTLNNVEILQLKSYLLSFLGKAYATKGLILQLHIGAQRETSTRLKRLAGNFGGFACIGSSCDTDSLCRFMDSLEQAAQLPKMILYTLNPADYEPLASLTGSFAEDGVPGKIQFGPAWWYNDHYEGIEQHLKILANYGVLSRFIGMTTDSRSPLSFSRHEYFRRILCNTIGVWVQKGLFPADLSLLSQLVKDISFENANQWILNQNTIYENSSIKS